MWNASQNSEFDLATLPLIDVGALRQKDHAGIARIADQIGTAARQIGFFRICNHGIDPELIEATYRVAQQFFAQPQAFKNRYYIGCSPNHRGYVPFTEKGDYADEVHRNYEAFDLGLDLPEHDPDFLAGNMILGPNIWPELPEFKNTVSQYYTEIASLGRLICAALEIYLQLPPNSFTDHMSKPVSQLRLLHYLRADDAIARNTVNMGAHTDYECLTLLHTRNEGLQVMTKDNQWIDVPVDPSVYVVNIGDMLEAWSNGILRSTPHRVINKSRERYSMPYFVAANHDTEIRPFAQLIGAGEIARYESFRAGEHLERMLMRDFPYLRARRNGQVSVSEGCLGPRVINPFESRIQAVGL